MAKGKPCSERERALLETRVHEGATWAAIGRELNRSAASVQAAFIYYNGNNFHRVSGRPEPALLDEAQRRRDACELHDLTGRYFGDPPPGYSALDQQRSEKIRATFPIGDFSECER